MNHCSITQNGKIERRTVERDELRRQFGDLGGRSTEFFHFHCGIFATVSSFLSEATLPDEFLALLSRRNNMQEPACLCFEPRRSCHAACSGSLCTYGCLVWGGSQRSCFAANFR